MELVVKGMTPRHCEAAAQRAVKRVAAQAGVVIARDRGRVSIFGAADAKGVESAICAELAQDFNQEERIMSKAKRQP